MPAASSSPINPAIGDLMAAAKCLDERAAGRPLMLLPWMRQRKAGPSSVLPRRRARAAQSPWTAKTLRGPGRHLPAAPDHQPGAVLGQGDVEAKTNGIPMFSTLLDRVDLAGAVVTADALQVQRPQYLVAQRRALPVHHQGQSARHACSACRPALAVRPRRLPDQGERRRPRRTAHAERSPPSRPGWPSCTPPTLYSSCAAAGR